MTQSEFINEELDAISEPVERFAETHNLVLGKCLRGNAGWELTRAHKEGGSIVLLMMYDKQWGLGIGSTWQVPCVETSMLYSHFRPMKSCAIDPNAVIQALDHELTSLSNVRFGHWTHLRPLHAESGDRAEH
jgi:hypothetical protein